MLPLLSNPSALLRHFPRPAVVIASIITMLAVVHFNTIIHPFTLADNRHYVFYVFAILRRHWVVKYAVTPIYFLCAWLVLAALGGAPENEPTKKTFRILHSVDTVSVSDALVWLVATTLSLVTAPLVEPRYFITPWLLWRLAVPEFKVKSGAQQKRGDLQQMKPKKENGKVKTTPQTKTKKNTKASSHQQSKLSFQSILRFLASYSVYIEMFWYLSINAVTGYVFLYKGFEWPQEPGNVQRFMW